MTAAPPISHVQVSVKAVGASLIMAWPMTAMTTGAMPYSRERAAEMSPAAS